MHVHIISAILSLPSLTSAATSSNACPPSTLSVRLPPYLDPTLNGSSSSINSSDLSSYLAPPPSFYTGTWYLTNTSSASYRALSNLQWDLRPVLPSCIQNDTASCLPGTLIGSMADLTTWALDNSSNNSTTTSIGGDGSSYNFGALGGGHRPVASIFGYDTPRRLKNQELSGDWNGVFDIQVSGGGFPSGYSETWSVLFWGVDAKEVPFMIVHEAEGSEGSNPPCLDVWTKSPARPDLGSLANVTQALMELESPDLTELVEELGPVKWNHALQGGPAICGKDCQENKAE